MFQFVAKTRVHLHECKNAEALKKYQDIYGERMRTIVINFSPMSPKLVHIHSRKPGNYNCTIIFEIDIMKKSSPLNLKFTFFATVKTKITLKFDEDFN